MAKTSKTRLVGFRATDDEIREIERICKALNISKTDYLRHVLSAGTTPVSRDSAAPAQAADVPETVKAHLSATDVRLDEIEKALVSSASAFDALLAQLNEILRVPTFREFRARDLAGPSIRREKEDELAYLVRLAHRYAIAHGGTWPDPTDSHTFGPVGPGCDLSKFPKTRPAG